MHNSYDYRECKTVAVMSKKLEVGAALNAVAHLAVALGHNVGSKMMGRPILVDAAGVSHVGISKYPIIITRVKVSAVRRAIEAARVDENLTVVDFPNQMLETGHDDELADSMAAVQESEIEYLGAMIYGPADKVDAITSKFSLWR
ncbi:MAG: hypothetical protein CMJ19_06885 [Phycisphaeraceae bacterium]|nr:hypothetical protein [Phycisphaeraceae bacterium]|tara:strand:- start:211 stop:645 length:435 start_codon:yes stop_codon:yes gene_type:complete